MLQQPGFDSRALCGALAVKSSSSGLGMGLSSGLMDGAPAPSLLSHPSAPSSSAPTQPQGKHVTDDQNLDSPGLMEHKPSCAGGGTLLAACDDTVVLAVQVPESSQANQLGSLSAAHCLPVSTLVQPLPVLPAACS